MHKLLCSALLAFSLLGMTACNVINQSVGDSISVGAPASQEATDLAVYQQYFTPPAIMGCIAQVRATPERRSCRDLITYARMRYIDINYEEFRRRVFQDVNGGNAATDIAVLGLNAAGTLVPGATTKAILAAISGGLVGSKGIIDKDVLYNAGIQTLILKMDADRVAVRQRITENLKQNEDVYSFEAAELDTGDYYRVGTLTNALITLQGAAGAALTNDNNSINTATPTTPAPSPPAAVAFSAAHPAPPVPAAVPTPPPAPVATPAPLAPVASPALPAPVASPAPPPAPTPIFPRVVPTLPPATATIPSTPSENADQTAFRAAYRGLKRDSKGVLTPESRQIVDQCAAPFFPAGTPIADIRLEGGANLKTITQCIKAKS
jgi:hypothetical protein